MLPMDESGVDCDPDHALAGQRAPAGRPRFGARTLDTTSGRVIHFFPALPTVSIAEATGAGVGLEAGLKGQTKRTVGCLWS